LDLDRTDEMQIQLRNTSGNVEAVPCLNCNRLQSYRVIESTDKNIGAGADSQRGACSRAGVVACKRTGTGFVVGATTATA